MDLGLQRDGFPPAGKRKLQTSCYMVTQAQRGKNKKKNKARDDVSIMCIWTFIQSGDKPVVMGTSMY